MSKIYDFKLHYNNNGKVDLLFDKGGLALDNSLFTSINTFLFTDDYQQEFIIGLRRGQINIDFSNDLWVYLHHKRLDSNTKSKITNRINDILNVFIDNGCWTSHKIEIEEEYSDGFNIRIITYNDISKEQNIYFIPYNNIWRKNNEV